MGHMKKFKCPTCLSTKYVIHYGKRKQVMRMFCKKCKKHFSFNPCFLNRQRILNDHLDGISFRKLEIKYDISKSKLNRICLNELKKLPNNNEFTHKYCNRYSHVFIFDGKYVKIKGNRFKIPLLWGIDYFRHDIPFFILSSSENYHSWIKLFSYFKFINHSPKLIVCDDNVNIKMAVRYTFPGCCIQTCINHFKENIRRELKVRSDNTYKAFSHKIDLILSKKLSDEVFNKWFSILVRDYKHDFVALSILANIEKCKHELLGYRGIPKAPLTSNLIECFNSHLQSRLFSIKSFNSFKHAKLWLNGYILKRRYTKFTSCSLKFRYLNGKKGVDLTKKHGVILPSYF